MNYLQRLISIFSSPSSSEQPAELPNALSPGRNIELGGQLYKMRGVKNNDQVLLLTMYIQGAPLVFVENFKVQQAGACTTIVLYAEEENHIKEFQQLLSALLYASQVQVIVSSNG